MDILTPEQELGKDLGPIYHKFEKYHHEFFFVVVILLRYSIVCSVSQEMNAVLGDVSNNQL